MDHPLSRRHCKPAPGMYFSAGGREYVLRGRVGNGAVGLVRRAEDRHSRTSVAVKFLAPDPKYIDVSAFDDVASRFRREGERGLHLDHDHLVPIIAYEQNDEGQAFKTQGVANPFIVMKRVRGGTLESGLKAQSETKPRLDVTLRTVHIARRVVEALQYLHERKIVHRDVKPANIFVSTTRPDTIPTEVRLGDFGVTKWGDFRAAVATGSLTMTAQHGLGTLKYMSPEQALRPKDVTVRSDMFSLGITLFELFTGRILPSPHHVFEIMQARRMRSSISGKLFALGILGQSPLEEDVLGKVLDLFLSPSERPTSRQMSGYLGYCADNLLTTEAVE